MIRKGMKNPLTIRRVPALLLFVAIITLAFTPSTKAVLRLADMADLTEIILMGAVGSQEAIYGTGPGKMIEVYGFDNSMQIPTDPTTGLPSGNMALKPLTIMKKIDISSARLHKAFINGERFDPVFLKFYRRAGTANPTHYHTIELSQAMIVAIKSHAPLATVPGTIEPMEEIAFTYTNITRKDGNEAAVSGDKEAVSKIFTEKLIFMGAEGERQGAIFGTGQQNMISVSGFGSTVHIPARAAAGSTMVKRAHNPLTIVKKIDRSSDQFSRAFMEGERFRTVFLKFFGKRGSGEITHYYTIQLEQAMIVSIKSHAPLASNPEDFAPMEEITFTYRNIKWIDSKVEVMDSWIQR